MEPQLSGDINGNPLIENLSQRADCQKLKKENTRTRFEYGKKHMYGLNHLKKKRAVSYLKILFFSE